MKEDIFISICGDICSECPRYTATMTNDIAKLEKIAKLWYQLGFRDRIHAPEDLKCTGCTKDKACSHHLNSCEHLQHIDNCGECDYFPCDKINLVFQKTEKAHEMCKNICTDTEYEELCRAFLVKRHILTEIHKSTKNR